MVRRAWAAYALLAWAGLALTLEQNCNRTQYEAHGKCCSKCPPGQKVRVPCSESRDTDCSPCPAQHFQHLWTERTSCTPHRYCDQNAGLFVHIQGSATQDVVCQCQSGTHCSGGECQSCREDTACGPGEGVEQAATTRRDTVCTPCPTGFFSNVSSATAPCQQWSSCEATGLVRKAKGTRSSDVVCEEAQRVRSGTTVLVALAAVIVVLVGVGLLLWHQSRRRREELLKLDLPDEGRNRPTEDEEASSDLPVQETLLTTQEEGKDSRLAEQERA